MTNEQLASFIQQDNSELIPILWERVKNLCFLICGKYFAKYSEKFAACGVELCDLRQECYSAFLLAVKSYKADSELQFTSFLEYPIRNTAAELLGIRNTDRTNCKPLDNAVSLDKPIEAADNDNMTLADVIPDTESTKAFERVLQEVADDHARAVLWEALEKLTERERDVIVLIFFEGKTAQSIAAEWGVSAQRVGQIKGQAIHTLRKIPTLKVLYEENRAEKRLHFNSHDYGYNYMISQQEVRRALRTGECLTESQRQKIAADCTVQSDPVYKALQALGRTSTEIITRADDTEIRQRAETRLQELSRYREITYGLRQAVYYDERQKLLAVKAITRTLSNKQSATL